MITNLEIHLLQLVAPFNEERGTDVEVELREGIGSL